MPPIRSKALAVAVLMALAMPAGGQTLADAADRLTADPRTTALVAACPADIWRTGTTWFTALLPRFDWTDEACEARPDACTQACLAQSNGEACLRLGILMDTDDDDTNELASRRAHALACAFGEPAGCTNRGGGIRNVPVEGDELSNRFDAATQACLARTFTIACEHDDSWGCAMSGQAYDHGEGVGADAARARTLYGKACVLALNPEFAACEFARRRIEAMGASGD